MNATINYTEFLTRVIDIRKMVKEDDIYKIFKQIDENDSGTISHIDISKFFKRQGKEKNNGWAELFFTHMTQKKNSEPGKSLLSRYDEEETKNEDPSRVTYNTFAKFLFSRTTEIDYPNVSLIFRHFVKIGIFKKAEIFSLDVWNRS